MVSILTESVHTILFHAIAQEHIITINDGQKEHIITIKLCKFVYYKSLN